MTCQTCEEMPALAEALRYLVRTANWDGIDLNSWLYDGIRATECPTHYPHPCAICGKWMLRTETAAIYPYEGMVCQGCYDKFETHTPSWDAQHEVTWTERLK